MELIYWRRIATCPNVIPEVLKKGNCSEKFIAAVKPQRLTVVDLACRDHVS